MKPSYSQTGGGVATDKSQTGNVNPNQSVGATWPFAKLTFYADHIDFRLMSSLYNLKLADIDSVNRVIAVPIIGDGLQINHHGRAPKILVFWSLFGQKRLLKEFEHLGVRLGATTHDNPVIKARKAQKVRVVIILVVITLFLMYKFFVRH